MMQEFDRKIILEDGQEYCGGYESFGAREKVCEIVFNTSMVGYQEILDPSYTYQAVVMTYPLIGNYGMAKDDYRRDTQRPAPLSFVNIMMVHQF